MTTDTVGGVWTYTLELAKGLAKQGVEVAIASMGAPLTLEQRRVIQQLPSLELYESRYKLEWMDDPWRDVQRAGDWLMNLEVQVRPDIVHLNGYVHGALPWRSPVLMVGHSCVLSWWRAVKQEAAPASWNRYWSLVQQGLQKADLVVAPSRTMLKALQDHYGPLPATQVIPNSRDPRQFSPGTKKSFILSAGRLWDEAKNLSVLEQAAPHLPWPIYVAGENRHPNGTTVPLQQVETLGKLSSTALIPWLERAKIYALPARYEPFGLSVLEAALSGCALVLGDIPSLRENWEGAALFVSPDDPVALQAGLEQLIQVDSQRLLLSRLARQRALQFTPQRMVEAYLNAYSALRKDQKRSLTLSRIAPRHKPYLGWENRAVTPLF